MPNFPTNIPCLPFSTPTNFNYNNNFFLFFRDSQSVSSGPRPLSSLSSRPNSSASRVYYRQTSAKRSASAKAMEKQKEKELREADELAKEQWVNNDEDFEELFVPEQIGIETMAFRFHDPYPKTWVDETVEDVCFRGKRKVDPFMRRLDELEDLQEETVLWEKLRDEKPKPTFTNLQAKNVSKNTVQMRGRSAKCTTGLSRAKSPGNKIKRATSAGRGSTTSNGISGSEESDIPTFRNSGYDMGVTFELGSMYPETRPKLKDKKTDEDTKSKELVSYPTKLKPQNPKCEACHYRKTARKHRNCKSAIPTLRAMRAQYNLKATECYDIVDIAHTFVPPCKNNTGTTKKPLTTDEKAAKKGIVSGKSNFSQRRISLTSEGMAVKGINPVLNNLIKPQTNAKKSAGKEGRKSAGRRK